MSVNGSPVELESIYSHTARLIQSWRRRAALSQTELAELVGTKQSVISRLESTSYTGHCLGILDRIATALGLRIQLDLRLADPRAADAPSRPLSPEVPVLWPHLRAEGWRSEEIRWLNGAKHDPNDSIDFEV